MKFTLFTKDELKSPMSYIGTTYFYVARVRTMPIEFRQNVVLPEAEMVRVYMQMCRDPKQDSAKSDLYDADKCEFEIIN